MDLAENGATGCGRGGEASPGNAPWERDLMQRLPALLWTTDRELRITRCSGSLAVQQPGMIDALVEALLDREASRPPGLAGAHRRALTGEAVPVEWTWGGRTYDVRLEPFREGTEVRGVLALAVDVTARRAEEFELRASRERYHALLESAQEMIYTQSLDGKILSVNRGGAEMLGYTREELLDMSVVDFVPPDQYPVLRERARRRQDGYADRHVSEIVLVGKDGRRVPVEVSSTAVVENGSIVAVQGIARDITSRRALEDQLRQAQKMEAIGRLAGGVAHDFNNMLAVINGYAELVEDQLARHGLPATSAQEIRKAGVRAAALTARLLAFSRKEMRAPRSVDLDRLLQSLLPMLHSLIGEDVELLVELGSREAHVLADPGQLEQLVLNLVVNARDAMPRGGRIEMRTQSTHLDPLYEPTGSVAPGAYVDLEVRDTGCGMDEETLAHIFEPFFTTKPRGKGSGLGLATVYGIVEQCQGLIEVRSRPGEGASFRILLPRQAAGEELASGVTDGVMPPAGAGETILLAEDETMVRSLVRSLLEPAGYRLLEAESGEAALRLAAAHDGPIHLLLTDVVMPRMSGRELAEQLAVRRPGVRVLYMSGYTDDAMLRHGVEAAATEFLAKPFTALQLRRKVWEMLR